LYDTSEYIFFFFFAAADLVASIQENKKKIALILLDKAKDICARHGVMVSYILLTVRY
jgi:hypothetical protein